MARSIQSPGVEIKEIDLSLRPNFPTGTNVLVAGFADTGPADEILEVTSLSEFETIYGLPKTPAERYFYHSVAPLFNSPATVKTYRFPYGAATGTSFNTSSYGALVYPASGFNQVNGSTVSTFSAGSATTIIIGAPTHFELTESQYNDIVQGKVGWKNEMKASIGSFTDIGNAAIIVLNKAQSTVNNKFEGYYLGIIDNTNLNDATDFDGIINAKTVTSSALKTTTYFDIPPARLNFSLSAENNAINNTFGQVNDSISEVMENLEQFNIARSAYDDTLSFGLFKIRQSVFAADVIKLDYVLSESYVGSVDYHRQIQSQNGGTPSTYFIGSKEDKSPNIQILINDYLSSKDGETWLDSDGVPTKKIRVASSKIAASSAYYETLSSQYIGFAVPHAQVAAVINGLVAADNLYTIGSYTTTTISGDTKKLGSIPSKLDRLFELAENPDLFDIDITVEAGLGTINAGKVSGSFDDTTFVGAVSGFYTSNIFNIDSTAVTYRDNWKTVFDRFADFAEKKRKDHLFIADLPRPLFVQGKNQKILNFSGYNYPLNVGKPIEAFSTVLNTSYATTYATWSKVYDKVLDDQVWAPFSGTAAQLMANTDSNFQPWFAPAGFTRGRVTGVNDIAIYPKQKQRDQLYKVSVNPVAFFPGDGFVVFGQKTLQAAPTAFDRINVRRLFLNLEKATRRTVKYFVFEPNTLLTRTRVINTLTPIFENARNTEGLYDYLIVCDERNNTPDVIDQNELVVDIYLKPVRAAEFILVNFYATRTGADFSELVG